MAKESLIDSYCGGQARIENFIGWTREQIIADALETQKRWEMDNTDNENYKHYPDVEEAENFADEIIELIEEEKH